MKQTTDCVPIYHYLQLVIIYRSLLINLWPIQNSAGFAVIQFFWQTLLSALFGECSKPIFSKNKVFTTEEIFIFHTSASNHPREYRKCPQSNYGARALTREYVREQASNVRELHEIRSGIMPRERFARGLFRFNAQLLAPCPVSRFLSSLRSRCFARLRGGSLLCACIHAHVRSCGLVAFSG